MHFNKINCLSPDNSSRYSFSITKNQSWPQSINLNSDRNDDNKKYIIGYFYAKLFSSLSLYN